MITNQEIPSSGFEAPESPFFEKWAVELIMGGAYLVGAVSKFIFGTKKDKPYLLLFSGGVLLAAGVYYYLKGWLMSFVFFGLALLLAVTGIILLIRRFANIRSKA